VGTRGRGVLSLDPPNKRAWYLPHDDGTSIEFEENKLKNINYNEIALIWFETEFQED